MVSIKMYIWQLKHIEHKVCNTNTAASKTDNKHTKKQAPSLRGTITQTCEHVHLTKNHSTSALSPMISCIQL